ncbi:MAG: flagellar basal body L-ring protein [Micavibrio sp.]|nr:flagellar basal body L-ring protein [Micavibrio sp.]|tara:strand:- start:838 stop:1584 length:747 start_codon:yes stop_codon:yes gene_type:complete
MRKLTKTALGLGLIMALSACGASDRIARIGKAPDMSPIADREMAKSQEMISLPQPEVVQSVKTPNSLWTASRTTFFEDQRANKIGDILTVVIEIDEEGKLENSTDRSRSSSEGAQLPALLGYESYLGKILPDAANPASLADLGSDSTYKGDGQIERKEEVSVTLAAMVSQKLPNGNLIIHGRQELLVNFEKRIIQIDGVIRPEDISVDNTIPYDKVAQARIVYGGEGQITDAQQPRYGQQLYDIIYPF